MATGSIFEQLIDPANRADPWPLYRELRKTPVTREADGTYVVSRYRDIVALLHDPRVSATGGVALPGRLVNLDPPVFLRRIKAIRRYYATLDPAAAAFFATADGEATTALANTGMRAGLTEMFFTGASMVAAVTGILAGAGAALLLHAARVPVPAAVIAGAAAALLAFGLQMLWMYRRGQPAMT